MCIPRSLHPNNLKGLCSNLILIEIQKVYSFFSQRKKEKPCGVCTSISEEGAPSSGHRDKCFQFLSPRRVIGHQYMPFLRYCSFMNKVKLPYPLSNHWSICLSIFYTDLAEVALESFEWSAAVQINAPSKLSTKFGSSPPTHYQCTRATTHLSILILLLLPCLYFL